MNTAYVVVMAVPKRLSYVRLGIIPLRVWVDVSYILIDSVKTHYHQEGNNLKIPTTQDGILENKEILEG